MLYRKASYRAVMIGRVDTGADAVAISEPLTFDTWIREEFARGSGGFTALAVLIGIGTSSVTPLRSTWLPVVGADLDWKAISARFDAGGRDWDGACLAARRGAGGGPLSEPAARAALEALAAALVADRRLLNRERFFNRYGRRVRVEEVR